MKRRVLQVLLAFAGCLMFFRFGGPALLFGTTGPGPLGDVWLEADQQTTLLLDADLRFFGALLLGLGVAFFWMIRDVERHGTLIRILCAAIAVGVGARIIALVKLGHPGFQGIVPIVIEISLALLIVPLHAVVAREAATRAGSSSA